MNVMESREFAKLIRDEPAEADSFSGEGHARSARSLAHAIQELSERDGAIGLEGEWGAGKSTVIKLAENVFASDTKTAGKYHFFCFDLWMHPPATLKLAFLEELIAWMQQKNLITPNQAKSYARHLSDRSIETTVENSREYKLSAVFYILLFPLLPLVYMWLSPFSFAASDESSWLVPLLKNVAMYVLPAMYVVFLLSFALSFRSKQVNNPLAALSAASRLFSRETDHDRFTQHVKERSPTGEEFQVFFRELLSEAQKKGDRVVFILDNIDRLPARNFFSVWSEARSIFAARSQGTAPPNSAVTAVIPFDANYIADAFKKESDSEESTSSTYARSLISKSFDLTLRVAPAVSTDWKEYLSAKLDWAFPIELAAIDRLKLSRLLEIQYQNEGKHPTPRSINNYVNEIGLIWNEWRDEIPVPHIALYVLNRDHLARRPADLQSIGIIERRQQRVVDGDWHRNIVALVFNVMPQHAYQVLLGQDIIKTVEDYDGPAFDKLSESPGFWEVLPDIVESRAESWAQNQGYSLASIAEFLSDDQYENTHLTETWRHLDEAIVYLDDCDVSNPAFYIGLSNILRFTPSGEMPDRAERLVSWFSRNLPGADSRLLEHGQNWASFVGDVTRIVDDIDSTKTAPFLEAIDFPQGENFALGVFATTTEIDVLSAKAFRLKHKAEELAGAGLELIKSDPKTLSKIVQSQPAFCTQGFYQNATDQICQRLQSEKLDPAQLAQLAELATRVLVAAEDSAPLVKRLKQQYDDGSLFWHIERSLDVADVETVTKLLWIIIHCGDGELLPVAASNHPTFGDISETGKSLSEYIDSLDPQHETIDLLASLTAESDTFSFWMNRTLAPSSHSLYSHVFRKMVSDGQYARLPVMDIIKRFLAIESVLDEELAGVFLNRFADWSGDFDTRFQGEKCLVIAPRLLEAIDEHGVERLQVLPSAVDAYFSGFSEDDWASLFEEETAQTLSLLRVRLSQGYRPPVGPYRTAIMRHAQGVLDGTDTVTSNGLGWSRLLNGIQKNTKVKVAKDTLINLQSVTTTTESVDHFIELYLELAEMMPFETYPDTTVDQLLTPLVTSTNTRSQGFVKDKSQELKRSLKAAGPQAVARFEEAVGTSQNSADPDVLNWANELVEMFDITIEKPDDGSEQAEE
jgi:hypothetical protein